MKIALLGAGRIGRLHARLLTATPGVEQPDRRRRRRRLARWRSPRRSARPPRRPSRRPSTTPRPSSSRRPPRPTRSLTTGRHRARPPDVLREAARGRPRGHDRGGRRDRAQRGPVPARLPAPLRRRLPRGPPARRRPGSSGRCTRSTWPATTRRRPTSRTSRRSGGLFRDFSIHDFDVLRWMTGCEVEEVYADGGVRGFPMFAKYDDVDTGVAIAAHGRRRRSSC